MFEQSLEVTVTSKGNIYVYTFQLVTAIGSDKNVFRLTENKKTILTFMFDDTLQFIDCKSNMSDQSLHPSKWSSTKIGIGNKTIKQIYDLFEKKVNKNAKAKHPVTYMPSDFYCYFLVTSCLIDPHYNDNFEKVISQSQQARINALSFIRDKLADTRFKSIICQKNTLNLTGNFVPKEALKEAVK